MPIEIRELIIKAEIGRDNNSSSSTKNDKKNSEQLIREAVEKTLETLQRREER